MRIGIDVGGTHISCALVDEDGCIQKQADVYTQKGWKLAEISQSIKDLLNDITDGAMNVSKLGVGVPGAVNSKTGFVEFSSNLPFRKIYLKQYLEDLLDLEVKIENDANCAAFGELLFGNGRGKNNIILITIGTGIGSGIILNKEVYSGYNGYAGEIGHHIIVANGRECSCGKRGCLESYASMKSVEKRANEIISYYPESKLGTTVINGKNIYELAKEGDKLALELINEQVYYLGIGIANIINILQPEVVLISGAVSVQKDFLINKLKPEIDKHVHVKDTYTLATSLLENRAGIIGAAFL